VLVVKGLKKISKKSNFLNTPPRAFARRHHQLNTQNSQLNTKKTPRAHLRAIAGLLTARGRKEKNIG